MTANSKTPSNQRPGTTILRALVLLLLAVSAILWWLGSGGKQSGEQTKNRESSRPIETGRQSQAGPDDLPDPSATRPGPDAASRQPNRPNPDTTVAEGPSKSRSSRRDGGVNSSGKQKMLVDPMASWNETPPWPEGPRLLADVETPAMRYVNLRPNEMGVMPSLNVKPSEVLDIRLSVPESAPGEPIYLELPNGGGFPGETARGKSLPVTENRTVSFSINAAALRGHCTVHIRQGGHTRTLPLWVGERSDPPPADPVDPNSPAI